MKYVRTGPFKKAFDNLPKEIKEKVPKAFSLFKDNPFHPSLHTKRVQSKEGVWEGRIDQSYRFTFHFEEDEETKEKICVFRNIGPHKILDEAP
jgi:mRNA-degrading endonuclease RelE of RelBE toxin-antitoxin system